MTITPIETRYAGCRFRSRLEARWAVFFDALGIPWEYEPQGFVLDGTPYLPDFRLGLADEIVFCEVKNSEVDEHEGEHVRLCRALAKETASKVMLLTGIPAYRIYNLFSARLGPESFQAAFFADWKPYVHLADEYWFQKVKLNEQTGWLEFPYDERGVRKSFGRGLVVAVEAARSARFERGERGAS